MTLNKGIAGWWQIGGEWQQMAKKRQKMAKNIGSLFGYYNIIA
jgi:hypothetical protein